MSTMKVNVTTVSKEFLFEVVLPNKHTLEYLTSTPVIATLAAVGLVTYAIYFSYHNYWGAVNFRIPIPEECKPGWLATAKILDLNNEPGLRTADGNIRCYCPSNGAYLGTVKAATKEDVDKAIKKARIAQAEWAKTSFSERRKVLRTLLRYILSNQDVIATAACLDTGKTKVDACFGEILVTTEKIKWTLAHGERSLTTSSRPTSFLMMYKKPEIYYEPLGVTAALVSYNYALHNVLGPIISSIFAGNAIVVKGSEITAWSQEYFINIVKGALTACKHNPDLIASISCWPDVAEYCTSHPSIAHLTFIGSRPVGKMVAKSASHSLTNLCIELGGKDPSIILDDYRNLNALASVLMRGVFQSAGQNCIGIERIIALPRVYSKLVSILEPRIRGLRLGSALEDKDVDCGAQVSSNNFDRLEALIDDAVKRGARLLVGGKRFVHPKHPQGHYFEPTLLVDVTPDMQIAQHETFAPICVMMKAQNVTHAIQIANSAEYGLGGSVFGRSKTDLRRVTRELKTGMVAVNDFAVFYLVQLPFGGVRESGYGRFGGKEGLRSLCNMKSVCSDRFPLISTSIPRIVDYPIQNASKSWEFCKGLVEMASGDNLKTKTDGILKLIKQ